MTEQIEIQKQFRETQSKLVYYVIGISVTCIGFAITRTTGQTLQWHHVILGISLIGWILSILSGFLYLFIILYALDENNFYFDLLKGNVPNIEKSEKVDIVAHERLLEKTAKYSKQGKWAFLVIKWGSIIAPIAFVCWHIWQMILTK